jgi:hypothetical protein
VPVAVPLCHAFFVPVAELVAVPFSTLVLIVVPVATLFAVPTPVAVKVYVKCWN